MASKVKKWDDKAKIAYAKQSLRRTFRKTRPYNQCLALAKSTYFPLNKDGSVSKAYRVEYICAHCGEEFPRKEVAVDHISAVAKSTTMDEWVLNLYCNVDQLQVLCNIGTGSCHKIKTRIDNAATRAWKKERGL